MLLVPRLLVAIALGLAASASSPQLSRRVSHESRAVIPRGWTPVRRAEGHSILPLRIGLTQSNLASIEEYLMDVSHPESPNYGAHWTAAKVAQTFRPSAESVETVRAWLAQNGIAPERVRLNGSGGWLTADVTVTEAEALLGTEYHVYAHEDGAERVGCDKAYHLPEHVSKHVDLITPTLHFDAKVGRGSPISKRSGQKAHNVGDPCFCPVSPKTSGTIKVCMNVTSNATIH